MTVANIGSINRDFFFKVPHVQTVDERIKAQNVQSGMDGKELKQSGAIALAGAGDDLKSIRRLRSGAVDVFPAASKLDNFTQKRPVKSGGV
ncbi:MAG: hypothetical protein ABJD13_07650 [Paracoccaceae bacterium]